MATDVSTTTPTSLNFAKGDGRLSPTLPAAGAGPLVIRLAPDVSPDDVSIVLDTEVVGYPTKTSTVNIVQVRITSTGDVLSFPITGQQDEASVSAQLRLEFANFTVWTAPQLLQQLGQVNHVTSNFLGTSGADAITGDGRNLSLYGLDGNDTIKSSSGNETLVGGAGRNQYVLNAGWGQDRIVSDWSQDTLVFGPGISSAQAKATAWGPDGDVRLSFANSSDSVVLQGLGNQGNALGASQGYLQFADGTRVTYLDLFKFAFQTGSELGETLRGAADATRLQGLAGDDILYSGSGADTLEGGAGDDVLFVTSGTALVDGGSGNDQYQLLSGGGKPAGVQVRFGPGSGHDTLQFIDTYTPGGKTTIAVDAGLKPSDVSVYAYRSPYFAYTDIVLQNKATGDSLRIDQFLAADASQADIRFADGTVWTAASMLATPGLIQPFGESLDLYGTAGADVLSTVAGKSTWIRGGGGADTYVIQEGHGLQTLDVSGMPGELQTILIKGHVNPVDVRVQLKGYLSLDLGGESEVQVSWLGGAVLPALKVVFDDGTIWSEQDVLSRAMRNGSKAEVLFASTGSDVYTLEPGHGNDTIGQFMSGVAGQANDRIRLSTSDVSFDYFEEDKSSFAYHSYITNVEKGLEITFNATGEKVRVYDARTVNDRLFYATVVYDNRFLKSDQVVLELADGRRLTGLDLAALLAGPSAGQPVLGTAMDDTLRGGSGNDTIDGGAGDDTIVLSEFAGAFGQDVVVHQRGSGRDTVIAKQDGGYTLRLGAGISVGDVYLTSSPFNGGTQGLGISGTADQIIGMPSRVEFADGTVLNQLALPVFNQTGQGEAHTFLGTQGADNIQGRASDDTIRGGAGDDSLYGGDGNNALYGDEGADLLVGGSGANTFNGGAGNDSITTQSAADIIEYNLGDGDDTVNTIFSGYTLKLGAGITPASVSVSTLGLQVPTADDPRQFTYGSIFVNGSEALKGGAPAKIMFADGTVWGPDQIVAATFKGTTLDDSIQGGSANELLSGQAGRDTLSGGAGDDTLDGGFGNDVLDGGTGKDTILYGRGDGRDTLTVGDTDTLQFKAGVAATDLIYRKAADGTLHADLAESLTDGVAISSANKFAGLSLKWADGSTLTGAAALSRAAANVYLDGSTATGAILQGGAGDDWISSEQAYPGTVTTLLGGKGRDVLIGSEVGQLLDGGDGNDVLRTLGGYSTLVGGAGADQFILDKVMGNFIQADGQDVIRFGEVYDARWLRVVRQGTAADDRVVIMSGGYDFALDHFSQLGTLRVQFADGTVLTGAQLKTMLIDQLPSTETRPYGSIANDQIIGTSGNDYFQGDLGNDFIDGGAGADEFRFNAGDGQDTIHADSADTLVFTTDGLTADGLQVDRIDPAKPKQVVVHIKGSTDSVTIDNLADATGMTIALSASGTKLTGAQILALANKPAPLSLTGTAKADALTGKDGDDTLSGLAGNDTLAGGKGNDSLIGGKGNDTYLFNRGDGQDVVNDTDSTLFNSDLLKLGGATSKQLWLTKSGTDLNIQILGTQDKVTVQNWYAGSANQVEKITASDGKSLSASKVNALVNAMASFTPPADAASLPANTPAAVTKLVASSWV